MEIPFAIEAKISRSKKSRIVTDSIVDSYHHICISKKDIILEQVQACERILKYTNDRIDQIILEKEIADLRLMLDLLE
jgi:hypothetical protein